MEDKVSYYFDFLPVHPPPETLESLTSYLIRLAEKNCLQTMAAIANLCFSDLPYSRVSILRDYPGTPLEHLQACTGYKESVLQATTFYHLGKKFGRMYDVKAFQVFLSGSLNKNLRYCPMCIRDYGYYSLIWRFKILNECVVHSCQLLDICKHCSHVIPIFPSCFQVGICSWCGGDLRACSVLSLSEEELQQANALSQDLVFLLTSQLWETKTHRIAQDIGQHLALLRQAKGRNVDEMAHHLVMPSRKVLGVEFEYTYTYNTTFQDYLKYIRSLDVSFRDVFESVQKKIDENGPVLDREVPLPENRIIEIMEKEVQMMRHKGEMVTRRTIRQRAQLTDEELTRYPSIKARLQQMLAATYAEYQQPRLIQSRIAADSIRSDMEKIQKAILELEALEIPVTCKNISSMVGLSFSSLRKDLCNIRLLNGCLAYHRSEKKKSLQDDGSIGSIRVKIAIDQLKELEESVTQVSIGKIVGIPLTKLMMCPQIQDLLQYFPESDYGHKYEIEEDIMRQKMEKAVEYLHLSGEALTQANICRNINMPLSKLYLLPKLALCMKRIIGQQKERIITNKILHAINYHKVNKKSISIFSISRSAHLCHHSVRNFPNVVAIIEQAMHEDL